MTTVARWREAARRMAGDPAWAPVSAMLTDTADDATRREPHQAPLWHAIYLTTGPRAHATAIATAYLARTGLVTA